MENRTDQEISAILANLATALAQAQAATTSLLSRFRDQLLGDVEDFAARADLAEDDLATARRLRRARAQLADSLTVCAPEETDAIFMDVVLGLADADHADVIALVVSYLDGHAGERAATAAGLDRAQHAAAMLVLTRLARAADQALAELRAGRAP